MAACDKNVVILPTTTAAASSTGSELNIAEPFTSVMLLVDCTVATGTSPTLNVYVQEVITKPAAGDLVLSQPSGTKIYDDFASITQITGTGSTIAWAVGGGSVVAAKKDGSLTVGTVRNGPIGSLWRVKYVIAGTNPSFTFTVSARLIP